MNWGLAEQEKRYITYWLNRNPGWNRNINVLFPDLTKPGGRFQDVKCMGYGNGSRDYYNLVCQKSELDRWNKTGIIKNTELKFIGPDGKIFLIEAVDFLNNCNYCPVDKDNQGTGLEYYILLKNRFNWDIKGTEFYNEIDYIVHIFKGL